MKAALEAHLDANRVRDIAYSWIIFENEKNFFDNMSKHL